MTFFGNLVSVTRKSRTFHSHPATIMTIIIYFFLLNSIFIRLNEFSHKIQLLLLLVHSLMYRMLCMQMQKRNYRCYWQIILFSFIIQMFVTILIWIQTKFVLLNATLTEWNQLKLKYSRHRTTSTYTENVLISQWMQTFGAIGRTVFKFDQGNLVVHIFFRTLCVCYELMMQHKKYFKMFNL